jgi:hypothetical protein
MKEQIDILNSIGEQNEAKIKKLEEGQTEGQTIEDEDLKKLEEENSKKSLMAEKLSLDISNIEKEKTVLLKKNEALSDRLSKSIDEYSNLSKMNEELMNTLIELQKEKDALKMEHEEDMQHIKGTLSTFLMNTPLTTRDNESILSVVYSMLDFSPQEKKLIDDTRKKNFPNSDKKVQGKGGLFGMFSKK